MNPIVLIELAKKWEAMSIKPDVPDSSQEAMMLEEGARFARRECAAQLRDLVEILSFQES